MQSAYSWMGTRIHLVLEDDVADAFNRAQQAFFDAQTRHKELHGTQWEPTETLWVDYVDGDYEIWNKFSDLINLIIEINGGSLHITEEEMTDDFLVKL